MARPDWWVGELGVLEGSVYDIRGVSRIPHYDVISSIGQRLTVETSTQLINALIEAGTARGDRVRLELVGFVFTKKKRLARVFRVQVWHPAGGLKHDNGSDIEKLRIQGKFVEPRPRPLAMAAQTEGASGP